MASAPRDPYWRHGYNGIQNQFPKFRVTTVVCLLVAHFYVLCLMLLGLDVVVFNEGTGNIGFDECQEHPQFQIRPLSC